MKMISKHFEITTEDILAGKYYPQSLIDPLWWSVSIYDGIGDVEVPENFQ